MRRYLAKLSRSLITRLIRQYRQSGAVRVSQPRRRRTRYTADDIALLAAVDAAHEGLSGPAVRHILWREYTVYNKAAYQRLASISASHIAADRGLSSTPRPSHQDPQPWGEHRRAAQARPARPTRRVDTVHQGDTPTRPGLYHINAVDTLTQWQVVGCCETISEAHLIPVLEAILHQFPFRMLSFRQRLGVSQSPGRETVEQAARGEFTKSRAHRTTDNALVEGKNGAVLRKHIGHEPIAACHAAELQRFYTAEFNSYLNYHRPCGFATVDGRQRQAIGSKNRTPYEKLLSLSHHQGRFSRATSTPDERHRVRAADAAARENCRSRW